MDEKKTERQTNHSCSLYGKLSVSTKEVPYHETSNASGGTTIYIGKEMIDDGS